MAIRALIVDDHHIFREGLRSLLEKQTRIEVLGEASDGRSAVMLAQRLRPDVVVMDIAMPGLNGFEATRQILAVLPDTRVLALSMHADGRYVTRMLQAGACGYLLKDCAFDELALAIETVARGQTYLSPAVAGEVVREVVQLRAGEDGGDPATVPTSTDRSPLTAREREVLQLVAEGNTTRAIAGTLHLSTKTIESHRRQIMEKLGLRSVAELTKYAIREGLTTLDP